MHGHHFFDRGGTARFTFQNNVTAVITFTKHTPVFISLHYNQITQVNGVEHMQRIYHQRVWLDGIKRDGFSVENILYGAHNSQLSDANINEWLVRRLEFYHPLL